MDFGVIVDVETTGLASDTDRIIEIGILEFAVAAGKPPRIVRCYGGLEDPGVPLSADITRITGLSDDLVRGQAIDWAHVRSYFSRSSLVIAHNADFDRAFLEKTGKLEGFSLHWACSMRHIDWHGRHFNSLSLNYLAADHGFINPFAHRAVFDCATTFRLMAPHLDELVQRSYEREYLVKAVGSPFESKDVLRQRGYRWDPTERCWSRILGEAAMAAERDFLAEHVYKGRGAPLEQEYAQQP